MCFPRFPSSFLCQLVFTTTLAFISRNKVHRSVYVIAAVTILKRTFEYLHFEHTRVAWFRKSLAWFFFSDFSPFLSYFIILPLQPGSFSRAHLLGGPMKRAILPTLSPWSEKYWVNERVMISNHLPEDSTCIKNHYPKLLWTLTNGIVYRCTSSKPVPAVTRVIPLISLAAWGVGGGNGNILSGQADQVFLGVSIGDFSIR